MLSTGPLGLHYGADLFAGVLGIKIVENIADHGKIVVSFGAVHGVVHRDKTNIVAGEDDFRKTSDLQIVPPEAAHVFDNPGADQALFHQRKSLLDTGTIKVCPGVPVIHQDAGISEAMVCGVVGEDGFLRCNV